MSRFSRAIRADWCSQALSAWLTRLVDQNWLLLLVGVVLPIIVVLFLLRVFEFLARELTGHACR